MNLEKLYSQRRFKEHDRVYKLYYSDSFPSNIMDVYHEVYSLIALGNFDEAENLILDYVNHGGDLGSANFVNLLASIYYFKRDWYSFFNVAYPYLYKNHDFRKALKDYMLPCIIDDINHELCDKYDLFHTKRREKDLRNHVHKKHWNEFKVNRGILLETVKECFYEARPYYSIFNYMRAFKCNGVGKDAISGKQTDYFIVVSKTDDPATIVTYYPTNYIGDLEYYDINKNFAKRMTRVKSNKRSFNYDGN